MSRTHAEKMVDEIDHVIRQRTMLEEEHVSKQISLAVCAYLKNQYGITLGVPLNMVQPMRELETMERFTSMKK